MTTTAPFPDPPQALLEQHEAAHGRLGAAMGTLPDLLAAVTTTWMLGSCTSALAGIRPAWFAGDTPPLFPAPRGYLSADQEQRLAGARAGFAYVDSRLALLEERPDRDLVPPEAPYVLNALTEGRRDREEPANPGMVRPGESAWNVREAHPYGHPPAETCRELVAATLQRLEEEDAPPPVAGAWLAFSIMSIHPFIDGNGRTARLLYMLVASPPLPKMDLGIAEQWVFHRHLYQRALSSGQTPSEHFDASILDAQPFADATIAWSAAGARLGVARAEALARSWESLELSDAGRAAAVTAALRGFVGPDDLPDAIGDYAARLDVLESLARTGLAQRVALPPSRRPSLPDPRPNYRLGEHVAGPLRIAAYGNRPRVQRP